MMIVSIIIVFTKGYILKSDNEGADYIKKTYVDKGYITLLDDYDSNNSNVYSFFSDKNSLKIMKDTEEKLKKLTNYYYIDIQDVYFKNYSDKFGNDRNFLVDEEDDLSSSEVGIKSVQLDRRFIKKLKLKIEDEKIDDKFISVYLGGNYKKYYRVGDIIDLAIYGDNSYKTKVAGFIKEADDNDYFNILKDIADIDNIDNYIVIPNLYLDEKDSQYKINMLQRCEGIIKITSMDEYIKAVNDIKMIADKTGFKYDTKIYSIPESSDERKRDKRLFVISIVTLLLCVVIKIMGAKLDDKK